MMNTLTPPFQLQDGDALLRRLFFFTLDAGNPFENLPYQNRVIAANCETVLSDSLSPKGTSGLKQIEIAHSMNTS
jgi:hypothetical protein